MSIDTSELSALAAAASAILEPTYARLEALAVTVASSHPLSTGWTERQLGPIADEAARLIAEDEITVGFGYVAAPGDVEDHERFMAWWQRTEAGISRLRLNFDPTSIDVYDYLEMEWFQLAKDGQPRVAFGPYVDYSGSELYIVTATVPVHIDGRFVGVAGADLVVSELERRLVAVLQTSSVDAAVVSGERRLIASNSPRWVVGSRLPQMPGSPGDQEFSGVTQLTVGNGWVVALSPM
jgi:hypothetical protein